MGLFGDNDAAEVNDNPFYVEAGVYDCVLSGIDFKHNEEKDTYGLLYKWSIETEGDYEGQTITEFIGFYPTKEHREAVEAWQLRSNEAKQKSRLAAIGLSNEQMNNLIDDELTIDDSIVEEYLGTVRTLELIEKKGKGENEDKTYTNIKSVSVLT